MGGGVIVIIGDSSRMSARRASATACLRGEGLRLTCAAINGIRCPICAAVVCVKRTLNVIKLRLHKRHGMELPSTAHCRKPASGLRLSTVFAEQCTACLITQDGRHDSILKGQNIAHIVANAL